MKPSVKLKLNIYHWVGCVLFLAGIVILVSGLVRLYKIDHRRDITELTEEDVKSGVYVSGTITAKGELLRIFPQDKEKSAQPAAVWTKDSRDGSRKTLFITNLLSQTHRFLPAEVDEYYYTELYHFMTDEVFLDYTSDEEYKFDAVIVRSRSDRKDVAGYLEGYKDNYRSTFSGSKMVNAPEVSSTWEYTLKLIDPSPRRLWWLYGVPFIFAGVMIFAIGGKFYRRIK